MQCVRMEAYIVVPRSLMIQNQSCLRQNVRLFEAKLEPKLYMNLTISQAIVEFLCIWKKLLHQPGYPRNLNNYLDSLKGYIFNIKQMSCFYIWNDFSEIEQEITASSAVSSMCRCNLACHDLSLPFCQWTGTKAKQHLRKHHVVACPGNYYKVGWNYKGIIILSWE